MTDTNTISADDKQKAIQWLTAKAPSLSCPSCGNNRFGVADHLVTPTLYSKAGHLLGGPTYPMFIVFCENCGFCLQYSAITAGLVSSDAESTENG